MRKIWRLQGISESYQIARRFDVPASERTEVNPQLASLYIDRWLADPFAQQTMVEMYESVSGRSGFVAARLGGRDLHRTIRPGLLDAFQRGELVVLLIPHEIVIPSKKEESEEQSVAEQEQPPAAAPLPSVTAAIREKPKALVYVAPVGGPLEVITLHADGSPPGGSMAWVAADPAVVRVTGSGATATVSGLKSGTTSVRVTYTNRGLTATDTITVVAFSVTIEAPSGDPVGAPSASNEFTYSSATPGVMTIECRARVDPDDESARTEAERRTRWSIDAIGDSALLWDSADPADATRGTGLNAKAEFTGLPNRHDDFGTKNARLTLDGSGAHPISTRIEAFWPKNDRNNPRGIVPNWFYYWSQVIGEGNLQHVRYGGAGPGGVFGETPAMLHWTYAGALNKQRILIYDSASTRDGAIAGLHGPLTGIDLFGNTFFHEREHVRQITRADAVVGIQPATCWQNGWSWIGSSNRWRLGPGRVAGAASGICTPAGPGTLGSVGSGDIRLDTAQDRWPDAWGAPPAPAGVGGLHIGGHPIEQAAFQQETSREHALAKWDWGAPGKNHRTVNTWND